MWVFRGCEESCAGSLHLAPVCVYIYMPGYWAGMKGKLRDCQWVSPRGCNSVQCAAYLWVTAASIKYIQHLSKEVWWHHKICPPSVSWTPSPAPLCTFLGLYITQPLFPFWAFLSQTLQIDACPWTFVLAVSSSWNPLPSALHLTGSFLSHISPNRITSIPRTLLVTWAY